MQTAAVTAKMGESMAKASEAMAAMGQTNDPAKVAQTMQQFQKENAKMEMGQEMMDDNLDGIFDDDDTEAETSDLMNQVSIPPHQHIEQSFDPHIKSGELFGDVYVKDCSIGYMRIVVCQCRADFPGGSKVAPGMHAV